MVKKRDQKFGADLRKLMRGYGLLLEVGGWAGNLGESMRSLPNPPTLAKEEKKRQKILVNNDNCNRSHLRKDEGDKRTTTWRN